MKASFRHAGAALSIALTCTAMLRAQTMNLEGISIFPEAIWADAAGGGTWRTELQITVRDAGTEIAAGFVYGTMYRTVELATTTSDYQTLYYPNILQTMQGLDGLSYFGLVGTLIVTTTDSEGALWAQAMTVNGNYGKTMPGLPMVDVASANVGRNMVIPNLRQNATYRTFVGCANLVIPPSAMTARFRLMGPSGAEIASFTKDFAPLEFKAFNPFAEAGLAEVEIANGWLLIEPLTCASSGEGALGLFSYGSIANNVTNDTCALIAIPFIPKDSP